MTAIMNRMIDLIRLLLRIIVKGSVRETAFYFQPGRNRAGLEIIGQKKVGVDFLCQLDGFRFAAPQWFSFRQPLIPCRNGPKHNKVRQLRMKSQQFIPNRLRNNDFAKKLEKQMLPADLEQRRNGRGIADDNHSAGFPFQFKPAFQTRWRLRATRPRHNLSEYGGTPIRREIPGKTCRRTRRRAPAKPFAACKGRWRCPPRRRVHPTRRCRAAPLESSESYCP